MVLALAYAYPIMFPNSSILEIFYETRVVCHGTCDLAVSAGMW